MYGAEELDILLNQQNKTIDPLVEKLKALDNDPLQITPKPWPASVSNSSLRDAIALLPSAKDKEFRLPGRARLGISIDESNPNEHDPDFRVYLDTPIGKTIIYYYYIKQLIK